MKTVDEIKILYKNKFGDISLYDAKNPKTKNFEKLKQKIKTKNSLLDVEGEIAELWNRILTAKEDEQKNIQFLLCFYFELHDEMQKEIQQNV